MMSEFYDLLWLNCSAASKQKFYLKQKFNKKSKQLKFLRRYKAEFFDMPFFLFSELVEYLEEIISENKDIVFVVSGKIDGELSYVQFDSKKTEDEQVRVYSIGGRIRSGLVPAFIQVRDICKKNDISKAAFLAELYVVDFSDEKTYWYRPFNEAQSILRKPLNDEDLKSIALDFYEVVYIDDVNVLDNADYICRLQILERLFGKWKENKIVHCTPYIVTSSVEDIRKWWDKNIKTEPRFEGAVIAILKKK